MKQIITGPYGRLAYFNPERNDALAYPALNAPCAAFARGTMLEAANDIHTPQVVRFPRQMRRNAALAMFGAPEPR